MRFIDLQIDGFGKLNNVWIGFADGTNLITGRNEAGKSTVYACLRAMFFGMTRAKGVAALTDTYSHYKPWFAKKYGAKLRVEHNGHIYCIQRDFLKDPVGCSVFDETVMEAVPYADRFVAELLLSMSEETYDNTISISKLKADGNGNLSGALKKYIVNMDTTGSHALNCARARAYLSDQKRKLSEGINPEASKEYALNCSEIKRLEKSIRESAIVEKTEPATAEAAVMSAMAAVTAGATVTAGAAVTSGAAATSMEAEAADTEGTVINEKAASVAEISAAKAAADEELATLNTQMQCIDAEIIEAREILRNHSIYSSGQVAKAQKQYATELETYEDKSVMKAVGIFRALYIVCFVLAVLDVFATAYVYGSNYPDIMLLGCLILELVFLVLGILFLILCLVSKSSYKKKTKAFSKVLEHYTGYDEVSEERIQRVHNKLDELMRVATDVEAKERQLAELSVKVKEAEEKAKKLAELREEEIREEEMKAALVKAAEVSAVKNSAAKVSALGAFETAAAPVAAATVNTSISKINELKNRNTVLKELLGKNDAINEEIDAIDMALEKLDEIADSMKDSLGVHLNARASEYINAITKGAYDSLYVDDDLNVFMNTKEKMVPLEQVSNGTSDQIYMALRLAGARLIQNGEDKLPLIFDDSFVNYDDERLAATLMWLVKEYRGQVIIFSCQNREEALLIENGLTFNPIHL